MPIHAYTPPGPSTAATGCAPRLAPCHANELKRMLLQGIEVREICTNEPVAAAAHTTFEAQNDTGDRRKISVLLRHSCLSFRANSALMNRKLL